MGAMSPIGSSKLKLSRRAWLFGASSAVLAAPRIPGPAVLDADWRHYTDPSTEFEVVRLTDSAYESVMPAAPSRALTRRSGQLLYASTRPGSWSILLMDLSNGRSRVLAEMDGIDPTALTLSADERSAFFVAGNTLHSVSLQRGNKIQPVYELTAGAQRSGALAPAVEDSSVWLVERRGSQSALKQIKATGGSAETLMEVEGGLLDPTLQPGGRAVAWRNDHGLLCSAAWGAKTVKPLKTPPGRVIDFFWEPEGKSLLYLLEPEARNELVSIRGINIDSAEDKLIAKTSQYSAFAPNANASVFLGASRSKASPVILVMLRATRREFTLCEHKSSRPDLTAPTFAPNSQRVFFSSDLHGKPALYTVKVEKLIEKTDS